MWGGPVPDCVGTLCRILGSLSDERGAPRVPGLAAGVRPVTAAERADWGRLPYTPAWFAQVAGLLDPAAAPADAVAAHTALWRAPSVSINGIQAGSRGKVGNVLMDAAWARLGVRIVPDQDPAAVQAALEAHLRAQVPAGMRLEIHRHSASTPWGCDSTHPVFARARTALARGFAAEPVTVGCGGSIPFVGEMSELLGGVPALLTGVEDPACGAHAENESLLLSDALSALRAQTALLGLCEDMKRG
jgi:acetylornithine deacetylase/succinyl-diaminopimelate desuccinylase-like protein